jgi:hypothetical protein
LQKYKALRLGTAWRPKTKCFGPIAARLILVNG